MITVTINGSSYNLPETGDSGWGDYTKQALQALANGALYIGGGAQSLTADIDFGTSYGVIVKYLKEKTASTIADTGIIRLANGSKIAWRNNGGGGNLELSTNASDQLLWGASKILDVSDIVNDLTTGGTTVPLSAEQGKTLNTAKVAIASIVNDLTTGGTTVPLSAEQGKTLNTNKFAIPAAFASDGDVVDLGWINVKMLKKTGVDFNASASQSWAHGLTITKIVGAYGLVIADSNLFSYQIGMYSSANTWARLSFSASDITVLLGSDFQTTDFDSTTVYLLIWYLD